MRSSRPRGRMELRSKGFNLYDDHCLDDYGILCSDMLLLDFADP